MRIRGQAAALAVAGVAAVGLLGGCGGGKDGTPTPQAPNPGTGKRKPAQADEQQAAASLGFPGFATKNTTRVGGADPVTDAAGVALAVYPSASADSRPLAVTLADANDWQAAISAAQLMSRPLGAPVLLSEDGKLPQATTDA